MSQPNAAVKALTHPIRRQVIECLANGLQTPASMAEAIDEPLGVVAYHVRMLRQYGVIEVVSTTQVRGAVSHSYEFTADATDEFLRVRALVDRAVDGAAGIGQTLVPA